MPAATFSVDWFSNNARTWRKMVKPALRDRAGVRALEVGSYEGRSALWLLKHALTGPGSVLVCVDNFSYRDSRSLAPPRETFLSNVKRFLDAKKCMLIERDSADALRALEPGSFDFVYVDGDRTARGVLDDLVNAFRLLREGGLLVVDDVTHSIDRDGSCPASGVEAFMAVFGRDLRLLHRGWQLIARKRAAGKRVRFCVSELHDS